MKKIFLFVAAVCCASMMYAVPVPINVHWEGTTIKWELPALTGDSVYKGVSIVLYTSTGISLSSAGTGVREEYSGHAERMYHGRTYYVIIHSRAGIENDNNDVSSDDVKSPDYTVPGAKDTIEFSDIALNASGYVSWPNNYQKVRATLQKKNGLEWEDKDSYTHPRSWNQGWSFGNFAEAGTYRAMVDMLQGDDVVRRGITNEIEIEETFTVSFDANDLDPFTAITPLVVAKNSAISSTPTIHNNYRYKTDGHFFYWSTDVEGNNIWDFSVNKVTQDTTLYAQWKEYPALNPVWDVDTCRWTIEAKYVKAFNNLAVILQTENDNEVSSGGIDANRTSIFMDRFFPGRKYKFNVTLTDFYYNEFYATSAIRTIEGEAETLPLENMHVNKVSTGEIMWDDPKYGVYMRHGKLSRWDKGISDWELIATHDDLSPKWENTLIQFGVTLDDEEYYHFQCQLSQGEYVIYEGELFYGNNPATGVEEVTGNGLPVTGKILRDGQLIIIRDGKAYNAVGHTTD